MAITPIRKQITNIQGIHDVQNENRPHQAGSVVQGDPKRQTGNKPGNKPDRQFDRESFKDPNRKASERPVQNPDRGR